MVKINNVAIKHNGLLADNSTKLTLYLPECTNDQHLDLIKIVKKKTIGIILVEPSQLEQIADLLDELSNIPIIEATEEQSLPNLEGYEG